jgi:hypothetical protein
MENRFAEAILREVRLTFLRFASDMNESHFRVCGSLRLLEWYYGLRELKESDSEMFRMLFYPCVHSPFAVTFQRPLTELSIIFQLSDPSISVFCFKYLMSHWPVASSRKQLFFLNQIQSILVMIQPYLLGQIECGLIHVLRSSIASPNHFVAAAALEICKSDVVKRLWWDIFQKELAEVIDEARDHWSPDVRESAVRLSNSFARGEIVVGEVKKEDSGRIWNALKNNEPPVALVRHAVLVE